MATRDVGQGIDMIKFYGIVPGRGGRYSVAYVSDENKEVHAVCDCPNRSTAMAEAKRLNEEAAAAEALAAIEAASASSAAATAGAQQSTDLPGAQ